MIRNESKCFYTEGSNLFSLKKNKRDGKINTNKINNFCSHYLHVQYLILHFNSYSDERKPA
jgi:hypothetical protein